MYRKLLTGFLYGQQHDLGASAFLPHWQLFPHLQLSPQPQISLQPPQVQSPPGQSSQVQVSFPHFFVLAGIVLDVSFFTY